MRKLRKTAFCLAFMLLIGSLFAFAANALPATQSIPGDITGDGEVNNQDAIVLMRYMNGIEVSYMKYNLDTDGDGSVTNRDVTILLQYLAGYEVTLHNDGHDSGWSKPVT